MRLFNPDSGSFRILQVRVEPGHVVVRLESRRKFARCPVCRGQSRRIHSRYARKAWDLPCAGRPALLVIEAKKFFCQNPRCHRKIFTERFPSVLASHSRRTERANRVLLELVHLGNAEHAARVAQLSGHRIGGDALLRMQRLEQFPGSAVSALGIDEFSWKKGWPRYGCIMVDLVRHKPVEVLPSDAVDEVKASLQQHAEVRIVARDRDASLALAAREALPQAIQVADRFHLVQNVHDAFETFVNSKRWITPPSVLTPSAQPPRPSEPAGLEEPGAQPTPRKQELWEAVQDLRGQGHSLQGIARILHIARATARKYANRSSPIAYPRYANPRSARVRIEPFMPYLKRRWYEDGVHNIRQLYEEVVDQGYPGGATGVGSVLRPWRRGLPAPPPPDPWISVRPLVLFTPPEKWSQQDRGSVEAYLALHPTLAEAFDMRQSFLTAVRTRDTEGLLGWIDQAARSEFPSFRSFSHGLRQDLQAVRAALLHPWSNGQTEGQNNRLKLIKRLGYGRAKPDLLRARVLHRVTA
ncbi:MAG TPA: ISL3 family transposase [Candidatus Krumholzibacteria bacterium]|nr:ISL3 family transposase [Candidatus Krumholzibacteria bacterium]